MSRNQELIDEALGRTTAVKINENKIKFQELMTVFLIFLLYVAFYRNVEWKETNYAIIQ